MARLWALQSQSRVCVWRAACGWAVVGLRVCRLTCAERERVRTPTRQTPSPPCANIASSSSSRRRRAPAFRRLHHDARGRVSSLRLLAKLASAAGRAARARAVGAGERAPPARVSGRAVTRWRRSGVRRHAGAVERAVRARGERREPPRFGTCEQPRGSRRPDERGRARRRRRIGRGRRAGGPRVGAEEREGFVGARSRSVGRARSSLVERHERVAPTRGERAGAGKGERASPRGVPGRARARAEHEVEEERNRGIYDLARARSARIVRAGTSARGLPRERVSARREGRGIARSRARASALARPRERSLGARAEKKRDMRGVGRAGRCGDVAMSRGREGGGRARRRARGVSLGESALLRSPRLGAGPRDFLPSRRKTRATHRHIPLPLCLFTTAVSLQLVSIFCTP